MIIKHWYGYGKVNAKKISLKEDGQFTVLHVRVEGNHERGLEMNDYDTYGVLNWLVKKFDKRVTSEVERTLSFSTNDRYEDANNQYGFTEICDYHIRYKV